MFQSVHRLVHARRVTFGPGEPSPQHSEQPAPRQKIGLYGTIEPVIRAAPATVTEKGVPASTPSASLFDRLLDYMIRRELHENLILSARFLLLFVFVDILTPHPLPLGRLMLVPIAIAAVSVPRRYVMTAVVLSAFIREQIGMTAWTTGWAERVVATIAVFSLIMFLWCEIVRKRKEILSHSSSMIRETRLRFEAEQRLVSMVQSMPTAVIAIDGQGLVRLYNEAAETLLGVAPGMLEGLEIQSFLPNLADIAGGKHLGHGQRSAALIDGHRLDGEPFRASVWFATYASGDGAHLVAILADASEDIRDFQESSLHALLKSTRVLVGSMAHEIRNICAAISVTQANLARVPGLAANDDFAALSALTRSLTRISTAELASAGNASAQEPVEVRSLIDEFRIITSPSLREEGVQLTIEPFDHVPDAAGDRHSLLQVLINLARNSARAMKRSPNKLLRVSVAEEQDRLCIRVSDSGPGVKDPQNLFKAFQSGADSSGLGLFISRALVRSCGGEIFHEAGDAGCTMCIRLRPWTHNRSASQYRPLETTA